VNAQRRRKDDCPPWSDPKVLAAGAALLTALAGGVELRVQVGLIASRLDQVEREIRSMPAKVADAR
jgi:hypothetical protein